MQKQAPTAGRLAVMVMFALSCFGLLLYLWVAFGGSIPLAPKGYRFSTSFGEATQLSKEADVRISGVSVGKVKDIQTQGTGRSRVTIQLQDRYAPIPRNTRAILRQKTLLGETYVELTPGDRSKGMLPDGGTLPVSQVSPTVELDEIFRTFDPKTREAFRTWFQSQAASVRGRGQDINDAFGNLAPFAIDVDALLRVLNAQKVYVRRAVRDTGTVFNALTARDDELRRLIVNSNRVFSATAQRDEDLKALFRALPEFQRQSILTVNRLDRFARNTNPLITELRPFARQLSPTLEQVSALAPDLKGFFRDLGPAADAARPGLPAFSRFLDEFRGVLGEFDSPLRNLNPFLRYLGAYRDELRAFFANSVAITQATDRPAGSKGPVHYGRGMSIVSPENLAAYPRRIGSNRASPYALPRAGLKAGAGGLEAYDARGCGNGEPTIAPPDPSQPQPLLPGILHFTFGYDEGQTTGSVRAPPCRQQAANGAGGAVPGQYPHLTEDPPPTR
ncbi:MAG: MCE family protein [Actinobacteria bacterium]|nr:MAG: MCE family protein [Actinomycetota bacterium]